MKKKIMLLGAGDFQFPLIKKAHEKYEVIVVAPKIPSNFETYIDKSYLADVRNKEEILQFAVTEKIDGIITDQTDIAVRSVAYVAEKMNLPGISYETGKLFTDKILMRKRLEKLKIQCLPYEIVYSSDEAVSFFKNLNSEVVIKPADSQGSRGIFSCKIPQDIQKNFGETVKFSSNQAVIIEKKATGTEFFVEGMSWNFRFKNLLCGKTVFFDGLPVHAARQRFAPADVDEKILNEIFLLNEKIITGFGLKQGISHSEYILDDGNLYLLETAARGGGMFISSDIIGRLTGLCTEDFLLDIALGKLKELPIIQNCDKTCGYISFYLPSGKIISVEGVNKVKNLPYVHGNQLNKIKIGQFNDRKNIDKTSRYCIIVSADSKKQFESFCEHIKSLLKIQVQSENGVNYIIWDGKTR